MTLSQVNLRGPIPCCNWSNTHLLYLASVRLVSGPEILTDFWQGSTMLLTDRAHAWICQSLRLHARQTTKRSLTYTLKTLWWTYDSDHKSYASIRKNQCIWIYIYIRKSIYISRLCQVTTFVNHHGFIPLVRTAPKQMADPVTPEATESFGNRGNLKVRRDGDLRMKRLRIGCLKDEICFAWKNHEFE